MSSPEPPTEPNAPDTPPRRQASMGEVVTAVFWSFFGVRKRTAMNDDAVSIRPYQFILVGILAAATFVGVLLIIVSLIMRFAT